MLSGRFAGCKAVVVKVIESSDDRKAKGSKARNQALVCGLEVAPKRVTKKSLKVNEKLTGDAKTAADAKVERKRSVKSFVKLVNFTHIMPTRYNVELHDELAKQSLDAWTAPSGESTGARETVKSTFKTLLEAKYKSLGSMTDAKVQKHTMYFFKCVLGESACSKPLPRAPPHLYSLSLTHMFAPRPLQKAPVLITAHTFILVYLPRILQDPQRPPPSPMKAFLPSAVLSAFLELSES